MVKFFSESDGTYQSIKRYVILTYPSNFVNQINTNCSFLPDGPFPKANPSLKEKINLEVRISDKTTKTSKNLAFSINPPNQVVFNLLGF
jgi:hypothetical protein